MAAPELFQGPICQNSARTTIEYLEERLELCLAGKDEQSHIELLVPDDSGQEDDAGCAASVGKVVSPKGLCMMLLNNGEGVSYHITRLTRFKLIFIRQRNSISPLSINRQLLMHLVGVCNISQRLLDFIICFGPKCGETGLAPPLAWVSSHRPLSQSTKTITPWECAYIVRFPELNHRSLASPWSTRQFLVYQQLPRTQLSPSFIFAGIGRSAEDALRDHLARQNDIQSLYWWELHLVLLTTGVSAWRPYLAYLAGKVDRQAERAVLVDLDWDSAETTQLEERQYLKQLDDILDEALLSLDHLIGTIQKIYENITIGDTLGLSHHQLINHACQENIENLRHCRAQARALQNKVKSACDLVSDILDLSNSNALKLLAVESARETAVMHQLTQKATHDAAAVKVLTVLTLIYLPATVISNFFSTAFVNTATRPDGSFLLVVASNWWIFVAGTLPLTGITIYIWWFYVQKEIHGQYPAWWRMLQSKFLALVPARRPHAQARRGRGLEGV
ncbi:hypothetical protein PV04_04568 [Phialophora macrospora]|uniref:Uncharacterized protein n=1 Tax=Phialophora macrospora TaxID=1851006 RepID=A0A0D2G9M0_9EURO|nr:hypothetical protein PV04_04568 [Phialophora macrospora]